MQTRVAAALTYAHLNMSHINFTRLVLEIRKIVLETKSKSKMVVMLRVGTIFDRVKGFDFMTIIVESVIPSDYFWRFSYLQCSSAYFRPC